MGDISTQSESFRIDVDVQRALEVLSKSVFSGRDESIRELIANAADSLAKLPPPLRSNSEIRLRPVITPWKDGSGRLEVEDTGIGMTFAEARDRLGRLFSSSKTGDADVIGRFGIGFYSCLPLCSKVEVFTRTRQTGDLGTHIVYSGGETMQIEICKVNASGTKVVLHLLPEHRELLETHSLGLIVRRYCNFIHYPIYVGEGNDLANAMQAPWYEEMPREDQLLAALKEHLEADGILAVIPINLTLEGGSRVRGSLFIQSSQTKPALHLYSQRVLISDNDQTLLGKELLSFVSAVIDVEDLPLVISRDGAVENSRQAHQVRECIIQKLADGLADLGTSRREDFRKLMHHHGTAIKAACLEQPALLQRLLDYFPYRSSTRPAVTVPEYLRGHKDSVVIYADDESVGTSLIPLYNQAGIEVLYMTDAVDRRLREQWYHQGKRIEFKRLDVDPPIEENAHKKLQPHDLDTTVLEAVRMLFRSAVDPKLKVEFKPMGESAPPAVLVLNEDNRNQIQFVEAVRNYQKEGRLNELPENVREMAKSGDLDLLGKMTEQTILLNQSNAIVRRLLEQLPRHRSPTILKGGRAFVNRVFGGAASNAGAEPIRDLAPSIAKFLYGQAQLSSGLHLSSEKLTEISQTQTNLIADLLDQITPSS